MLNGHRFLPYELSDLFAQTLKWRFWSILDLDGSFAAGRPSLRAKVRAALESIGVVLFCTARTPELVMSRRSYELSKLAGFYRPEPRGFDSGGIEYDKPLDQLPREEVDPDVILAFCEGIYIRSREGAYLPDLEYERTYLDPVDSEGRLLGGRPWREIGLELVDKVGLTPHLAPHDKEGAYEAGKANVAPTKFRIQLDFKGPDAVEQKYKALCAINAHATGPCAGRIEGVDESKPSDLPQHNKATLYVVPPQARKENMINYVLRRVCRNIFVDISDMRGVIFGDTLTDYYAMCYAGWNAGFDGVLAGGSRLAKPIEDKCDFAGVNLRHMHNALASTSRLGEYEFVNPLARGGWMKEGHKRNIYNGDYAFAGTTGVETLAAYLRMKKLVPSADLE